MDLGLEEKVAIVTGGSDGIGRATAEVLVEEGARVVICARGEEKLANALALLTAKGKAHAVVADVTRLPPTARGSSKETMRCPSAASTSS